MNRGDIYNYYLVDRARAIADYDRVIAPGPEATHATSVCGHRLVALHGGMTLALWLATARGRRTVDAGCGGAWPGF